MGTPKPVPASVQEDIQKGNYGSLRRRAAAGGKAAAESRIRNNLAKAAAAGHDQYENDLYDEAIAAFKPEQEDHPALRVDPEEE